MAKILTLLVLLMTAVTGAWAGNITVYFTDAQSYGDVNVYYWPNGGDWPGSPMTPVRDNEFGQKIYKAVIPADVEGIIFNGNGRQTVNITENIADEAWWFANKATDDQGHNTVGYVGTYFIGLTSTDGSNWTFQTPDYDVELEVEYFPLATLTAPTAADGLIEGSVADLLTAGTSEEGTLNYAVSQSDTEAPASGWSETIPTTEGLEAGTYYVWYKVVGDAEHSDIQPQSIEVTIAALPTFAITIDDGNKDAGNWQADPTEQKAGQKVTLTYGGKKKIRSITIEKAETAPAAAPTLAETLTTAGMTVKVNYNYNGGENSCSFLSNGDGTYTFQSGEGNSGDADHRAKALVVEGGKLVFKQNFYSSFDNMYDLFGFSVTFDTSNNTYSLWFGLMAESNVNPSFISVEVNGTQIAVTAAQ